MADMESYDFTSEELFVEVVDVIDNILREPLSAPDYLSGLWDNLKIRLKQQTTPTPPQNDLNVVCAVLFYTVAATLSLHWREYYNTEITNLLVETARKKGYWQGQEEEKMNIDNLCVKAEELEDWINSYEESNLSLHDELNDSLTVSCIPKSKTSTQKKKGGNKLVTKAKTLKYYVHGNNGVLRKQRKRVDLVFEKWNEWKWLDSKTNADDFDSLFEGEARNCNIEWKANTTILTILLQELLKQSYIENQTRQSATSMVKEQFGKAPNSDQKRLTDEDNFRIGVTIYLLNIDNPLPLLPGGGDNDYTTTDAALKEVLSGHLRVTKGI